MIHLCAECGFTKECSEDEFAQHFFAHFALGEILDEMGVVQEERQYKVTVMPGAPND